jgi:hypothetical protein
MTPMADRKGRPYRRVPSDDTQGLTHTDDCTGDPVGAPLAGAPDDTHGRPHGRLPGRPRRGAPCGCPRWHLAADRKGRPYRLVRAEGGLSPYGRVMLVEDAGVCAVYPNPLDWTCSPRRVGQTLTQISSLLIRFPTCEIQA